MSKREKVKSIVTKSGTSFVLFREGTYQLRIDAGGNEFTMFMEEAKLLAASILSIMNIDLDVLQRAYLLSEEREAQLSNTKVLLIQERENVDYCNGVLQKMKKISEDNEKELNVVLATVKETFEVLKKKELDHVNEVENLKDQLEKYKTIAKNNQPVFFNGLKLKKKSNKWKKKFKKIKAEYNKELDVMLEDKRASEGLIEMLQEKVDRETKKSEGLKKERDQLQKEVSYFTTSNKIMYNGETLKSPILEMVALERKYQLERCKTIEMDVLHNQDGSLIDAALYCLEVEGSQYPKNWQEGLKNSLKNKTKEQKIVYAATLLIAHGDMLNYIREKNEHFDKISKQ